jgi:hypothetical protein
MNEQYKCNYFQQVQALVLCEFRSVYLFLFKQKFLYITITRYLDIMQTPQVTTNFLFTACRVY